MELEETKGSSQGSLEVLNQGQKHLPPDGQESYTSDLDAKEETLSDAHNDSKLDNHSEQTESALNESEKESKLLEEGKIDDNLYDEILEKLDIKPKSKNQDVQEKPVQENLNQEAYLNKLNELEKLQTKIQVEKAISQDFSKIQTLVNAGLINSVQGQNLKKQVLKNAFDMLVQTEKIKRNLPATQKEGLQASNTVDTSVNKKGIFEEFSKNNPNFFTSTGRKEVLDYLKSNDVIFGRDELNKISEIIRTVEKGAIDRYLQKAALEKTLRDSNEAAKQRLTANAQKSGLSGNLSRTFTREQIGKMNSAEFIKYESAIMEQLKKGLIR